SGGPGARRCASRASRGSCASPSIPRLSLLISIAPSKPGRRRAADHRPDTRARDNSCQAVLVTLAPMVVRAVVIVVLERPERPLDVLLVGAGVRRVGRIAPGSGRRIDP